MTLPAAPSAPFEALAREWAVLPSEEKYLIVGAGPGGLGTARSFLKAGIAFEQVERHSNVGGIWDMTNTGTPMYETANFISSKTKSAFANFPMPDDYPDYPTRKQIQAYVEDFADAHGLRHFIRFNTEIVDLHPDGDLWRAVFGNGSSALYRGAVLANGFQWDPNLPNYPGNFTGESFHSVDYKSPDQFRGKRVLVVGGGNSAVDIACDAAFAAKDASISMRRGYYFLPKHVGGVPLDTLGDDNASDADMLSVGGRAFQEGLKELLDRQIGDVTRLGLQAPEGLPLEHHPIVNSQVLHYLAHGRLRAWPDVERLDGGRVRFVDGRSTEVDLIVYCTGYKDSFPFVDERYLDAVEGRSDLYVNIFHRRYANLFVTGLLQTDAGGYWVSDMGSDLVANYIRDQECAPARAAVFRERVLGPEPDLTAGYSYQHNDRHSTYVNGRAYAAFLKRLGKEMGWRFFSFEDMPAGEQVKVS